jgi:hypothetical protein
MGGVPCIFVGHDKLFQKSGGGVQLCNSEHMSLLEAAGFELHELRFEFDNALLDRGARYFSNGSSKAPRGLRDRLARALTSAGAKHIFFGFNLFEDLSQYVRREFPQAIQILLSHGVEAVDVLIEQRLGETVKGVRPRRAAEQRLGRELVRSAAERKWIDGVISLSPFDVEIEKWLGTKACLWAPATISDAPLAMQPIGGRVGCVSTLDHSPNWAGLIQLFEALQEAATPSGFEVRLVGQPKKIGAEIAGKFPFVRYLGPLSDLDLAREATTWCSFINPIFVNAKGRSTKIGLALGWRLPIATTELGVRGYIWDQAMLPTAGTPSELARLVIDQSEVSNFDHHRKMTEAIAGRAPGRAQVAEEIRAFVEAIQKDKRH